MKCPACGADNREGARFCRSCGAEMRDEAETEASAETESPDVTPEAAIAEIGAEAVPVGSAVESEQAAELPGVLVDEGPELERQTAPEEVGELAPGGGAEGEASVEPAPAGEGVEASPEPELAGPVAARPPAMPSGEALELEGPLAEAEAEVEWAPGPAPLETPETGPPLVPEHGGVEEVEELPPEPEDALFGFWRDEAEPLQPLSAGTVIADRYAVTEVLDAQSDEVRYLADDLQRCWQCNFDGNDLDDEFCRQCGASLDRGAAIELVEVQAGRAMPSSGESVTARLSHAGRHFLLLGKPRPEPEVPVIHRPPSIRLLVGQKSDKGQVRDLDEDSLFALTLSPTYESRTGPVLGLFAVADGLGGYEGGEVASRLAIQTLADRVLRSVVLPELAGQMMLEEDIVVRLRQATVAANDDVYLTRMKGGNEMGTTLTAAFVRDDRLFLSHVGDSRAYRWSAAGLEQLTTDHSVVASLIAEGRAAPEEIYTHPHRSVVYRCIGDKPVVDVDTDVLPLALGERLILCCDGLWEMIRNEGIADVMMQESDPQVACDLMVSRANAAGGEDNISVIVVQVEEW